MKEHRSRLLRRILKAAMLAAEPGSWDYASESRATPDGRAVIVATAIPLDDGPPPRARPAEVPVDVMDYVRNNPGCLQGEIFDVMAQQGHDRTASSNALRVLVQLGYITRRLKGGPYYAADATKN